MPAPADEFLLDLRQVRRAFDDAAVGFDAAAAVHAEIRARLLERLDLVRLEPQVVLDLGAATGHASRVLKDRYRRARVLAFDMSLNMLRTAEAQQRWMRRFHRICGDAHSLPLRDASVDLVFSNLMLQWCNDPDAVFRELRRVLRPDGLVSFTTLGPDSLQELRRAWAGVDGYTHVHRFIDMHDLGDALMRNGFAEPVMDTERLTITYPDLDALIRELRLSGSANVAAGRPTGLTGRHRGRQLQEAETVAVRGGVITLTLEVVYGHAWAGTLRERRSGGEARVPLSQIGRR
jgi:malonyl-CoA O-methyltransferase